MQSSPHSPAERPDAETAEEAVLLFLLWIGRRLRHRLPGDTIEASSLVLLKTVAGQGPVRLTTLAQTLDLDASTVSRQVRSLEDRGLLERAADPDDARASQVAVSPDGQQVLRETAERRLALIGEALDDWSDTDRETLRTLLLRLTDDFSQETP